jgi:hypothetical protein
VRCVWEGGGGGQTDGVLVDDALHLLLCGGGNHGAVRGTEETAEDIERSYCGWVFWVGSLRGVAEPAKPTSWAGDLYEGWLGKVCEMERGVDGVM